VRTLGGTCPLESTVPRIPKVTMAMQKPLEGWTIADSLELYDVQRWGKGFFGINQRGHLTVHPNKNPQQAIDLKELVDRMELRDIDLPILFRFGGIIQSRLQEIYDAFQAAIRDHGYRNGYCCVYPIKVNQQRQVLDEIVRFGQPLGFGLEAGSKPELLAVIALACGDMPIICNGFKDPEFIEMAMLAHKMGRRIIPVVEKYTELPLILQVAEKVGVRPTIGMRAKLATRGAGRWNASGGFRSKFGLTVSELLQGLQELQARNMADCLQLLHFHLGSQITDIRHIKAALNEATRIYVELAKRGAGLRYLDVGGGLGVDYDGSQTNFQSSINYSLQEYANDIVHVVGSICDDENIPHPQLISESGRAVASYHSALVFNVLGVSGLGQEESIDALVRSVTNEMEQPLLDLRDAYTELSVRNLREVYHDAQQALDTAMNLFTTGYLPLDQRSLAENLFWGICRKIRKLLQQMDDIPEEFANLDALLSETYFGNFSLFQSLPDSWAVKQLFPVMPIHRLDEEPKQHAVLGDITCDSDGKIDHFIDLRDVKRTLLLHRFDGRPYYLGVFLVGAYQEILGDMHNLFGDTNAVHVNLNEAGEVVIETVVKGDTVKDVLAYVDFDAETLIRRLRSDVERAVRESRLNDYEAGQLLRFYEEGMRGYTYLEETPEAKERNGVLRLQELASRAAASR
jgi:arginine decarboxylase